MSLQTLNTGAMLDLTAAIGIVAADVANVRATRGLPALVCNLQSPVYPFYLGGENEFQETSAPRVVFIPRPIEIAPARTIGQQPSIGAVSQMPARPFGVRGYGSTSSSGATTIRRASIRCSPSTTRSRFTVSYSARSTGTSGAPRTCASSAASVETPLRTTAPVGSSSSRWRGRATSPMSRSRSFPSRSPVFRAAVCRSISPSRCSGRTAAARSRASSSFRTLDEVT